MFLKPQHYKIALHSTHKSYKFWAIMERSFMRKFKTAVHSLVANMHINTELLFTGYQTRSLQYALNSPQLFERLEFPTNSSYFGLEGIDWLDFVLYKVHIHAVLSSLIHKERCLLFSLLILHRIKVFSIQCYFGSNI